jgi:DNA-binding NarL/FixJ family response regulator
VKRTRILLADDHIVVIEGLRRILEPEFEVVGVAADGRALVEAALRLLPDVIVADVSMPLLNGIDAAAQILQRDRKAKLIFLSMHAEAAYANVALGAGACGYVLKSAAAEELITAIRLARNGGIYVSNAIAKSVEHSRELLPENRLRAIDPLTPRQREILHLLAEGKQAKEIAAVLGISSKTVEFHKYRIMDALGIRTVAELTRYAVKRGM